MFIVFLLLMLPQLIVRPWHIGDKFCAGHPRLPLKGVGVNGKREMTRK